MAGWIKIYLPRSVSVQIGYGSEAISSGTVDAVKIKQGMKPKDLGEWFAPVFEAIPGALPPLRFRSGMFYAVHWSQNCPLSWPTAKEIPLNEGDYLVACDSGGVAFLRGQYALQQEEAA